MKYLLTIAKKIMSKDSVKLKESLIMFAKFLDEILKRISEKQHRKLKCR